MYIDHNLRQNTISNFYIDVILWFARYLTFDGAAASWKCTKVLYAYSNVASVAATTTMQQQHCGPTSSLNSFWEESEVGNSNKCVTLTLWLRWQTHKSSSKSIMFAVSGSLSATLLHMGLDYNPRSVRVEGQNHVGYFTHVSSINWYLQ